MARAANVYDAATVFHFPFAILAACYRGGATTTRSTGHRWTQHLTVPLSTTQVTTWLATKARRCMAGFTFAGHRLPFGWQLAVVPGWSLSVQFRNPRTSSISIDNRRLRRASSAAAR
jgi:hypothetical protein